MMDANMFGSGEYLRVDGITRVEAHVSKSANTARLCTRHGECVQGQFSPSTIWAQGNNSSLLAWWQAPLPAEPCNCFSKTDFNLFL